MLQHPVGLNLFPSGKPSFNYSWFEYGYDRTAFYSN